MSRYILYLIIVCGDVHAVWTENASGTVADLCNPTPCGLNTTCKVQHEGGGMRAVCTCFDNFFGNPYQGCRPECVRDSECSASRHCRDNGCRNPCIDGCGVDAFCDVQKHTPICSCPESFQGDPYSSCYPRRTEATLEQALANPTAPEHLCAYNTCGFNAVCKPGKDISGTSIPICTCPTGFIGNAKVTCQRGICLTHNECPDHRFCQDYLCKNPCDGSACAKHAACVVTAHKPVCTCPESHKGDPTIECIFISEQPSIEPAIEEEENEENEEEEAEEVITDSSGDNSLSKWFQFLDASSLIESRNEMSYQAALQWCHIRNAVMFKPLTDQDYTSLLDFLSIARTRIWVPFTDVKTEGSFVWEDGAALSKADEQRIPWYKHQAYIFNDQERNCAMINRQGMGIGECLRESVVVVCQRRKFLKNPNPTVLKRGMNPNPWS